MIYKYINIYIYLYCIYIYTHILCWRLWLWKFCGHLSPDNQQLNTTKKKQNAIPAAEFSMSFAASAVWPPATGTEVWNKAAFQVLSFRFGSFPFVKRFQKKTAWHWNLQPAISLSGNPFSCCHCFFEATLTCRTLWARAHQLLSLSAEMGTIFQSSPGVTWDGNSIKG